MVLRAFAGGARAMKGALKAVVGTAVATVGAVSHLAMVVLTGSDLAPEATTKEQTPSQRAPCSSSRSELVPQKASMLGPNSATGLRWSFIIGAVGAILLPLPRELQMLSGAILGAAAVELLMPREGRTSEGVKGDKGQEGTPAGGLRKEADGNVEKSEEPQPADSARLSLLAKGTFAKVYRDGNTAVKVMEGIEPEDVQQEFRFMQELGGRCNNIPIAWDLKVSNTLSSFRMPLCQGTSIDLLQAHQRATGQRGLPEKWVLQILKQTALALHECHSSRVCHLDAKPDNILLVRFPCNEKDGVDEGSVKLTDFGLSLPASLPASDLKRLAGPRGTRQYMAPEMRVWGKKETEGQRISIGYACDMYSLGCSMTELLTGVQEGEAELRVSEATRELLSLLKMEDPRERITAAELLESDLLLQHPLLQ